jgi:PAS domain S-box-containing protein
MPRQITESLQPRYQEDLRRLRYYRTFYLLLIAVALLLSFSLLDYFIVPGLFSEFLQYRLVASIVCLFLFYINYRDVNLKYTFVLPFAAYLFSLFVMDLMVIRMGGIESPYFSGFIIALVIFTAMVPLTMTQTLISGLLNIALYLFSVLLCCPITAGKTYLFVNNIFFMSCFILLVTVQSWYETKSREESFLLSIEEKEAAEYLEKQADFLEQEVAGRSKEHRRTENRFHRLFDHIVDDVILVSERGRLLFANASFFKHLRLSKGADVNLLDFIKDEGQEGLSHHLLARIAGGEIISGYQTKLHTIEGESFDVEINGNKLERRGRLIGLQLIIRDISVRKRMEQELHQGLLMRKQTENAAIMALARLSEHRDITPNNHLERIREYSRLLAEELALRPEYRNQLGGNGVSDLAMASVLHDIGKVGIPDSILFKSGLLNRKELDFTRQHTLLGGDVIKAMEISAGVSSGFLRDAKNIAYFHHEKWDGSGYPFGLVGDEIPLAARIVALADAYEGMTSSKEYTKKLSHQQAVHVVIQEAGHHFDPDIVDAFVACEHEFNVACTLLKAGRKMQPVRHR